MQIKIYPPLKEISYYGTMLPLKDLAFLKKVLNATGQPFGVDWSGPACRVNSAWPCDKTYYQQLGLGAHNGIDMPCANGTPVYAAHNGKVTELSNDVFAGLGVVLWDKVQNIKTVYWHFKENKVELNQDVKQGELIGLADSTGYSLGNHVHFMLKQTDEMGSTINKDNGFGGAMNPLPYLIFNMDRLVRVNKDVFRLHNGVKDLFLNKESFEALDGRWDKIEDITQVELDAIPDGFVLIAVKQE